VISLRSRQSAVAAWGAYEQNRIDQAVAERHLERMIGRMIDVNYHLLTECNEGWRSECPSSANASISPTTIPAGAKDQCS
jgi:hypothetical protein